MRKIVQIEEVYYQVEPLKKDEIPLVGKRIIFEAESNLWCFEVTNDPHSILSTKYIRQGEIKIFRRLCFRITGQWRIRRLK